MAILTIAREYGSGGKEIGRAVAKLMGYRYVDRKQLLEEMRKTGKQWEEKAKYYDENHPDIWERYDWSYRGFVALNQSYILNNALQGNVVIMGRGGNFLLKGIPFALRVRTTASLEKRIENVMRWEGEINSENAQYLIEKADSELAGSVYVVYGSNWDDPTQYDMLFNTSVQTYEEIISIIKDELTRREQFNTEAQRKIFNLRALAANIKAAIVTDPTFSISTIGVHPKEEGLVEYGLLLRGVVHNKDEIKRIEEIATRLAGTVPIECKLQYRWHPRFGSQQFR